MTLCTTTVLPLFMEQVAESIEAHNADPEAHPAIRKAASDIDSRLSLLELMYNTDVSGNPFTVTFENLDGVTFKGVFNEAQGRVEF